MILMRKYLIGMDGGGTKTTAILSDIYGNVVCCSTTGGTNHQIIGIESASESIRKLVMSLLDQADLKSDDIGFLLMGLAGADTLEDINYIENSLAEEIAAIPHKICTDTWVAFAAGTPKNHGAISICGTGHNTAVKTLDGEEFTISALKFALGNFGGGRMISDFALHAAFRDYEHIGQETRLTGRIAEVCGTGSMEDLRDRILNSAYTYQYNYPIPKLVSELSGSGDEVSSEILRIVGKTQGEMTGRLLNHAGLEKSSIPIVMAGGVYCGGGEIVDSFCKEVKSLCPYAELEFILLQYPPVIGALVMASRIYAGNASDTEIGKFYEHVVETYEEVHNR